MAYTIRALLIACFLLQSSQAFALGYSADELPSYQELVNLLETNKPSSSMDSKVQKLFAKPLVSNRESGKAQLSKSNHGTYLRLSQWNIERGYGLDIVKELFKDPEAYLKANLGGDYAPDSDDYQAIKEEIEILTDTDILTINEADYGVSRTKYQNIPEELAKLMGGSYVFAPEFIEVDPTLLMAPDIDQGKYKGIHGNAIVSRFPITKARMFRLPRCYDWLNEEQKRLTPIEKGRRFSGRILFNEKIKTEIRYGDRTAIVADIKLPNQDTLTIVSTHLEDRTFPRCRLKQIDYVLNEIKDIKNPVVLAGDFNTVETDLSPASLIQFYNAKIADPAFLARIFSSIFNPIALIVNPSLAGANFIRKFKDPAAHNVPFLFQNKARSFFRTIKDFRFADGDHFDFSGDEKWSHKRDGDMSNSNQRWLKGFVETFQLERAYKVMRYKLDWIFAKPNGNGKSKHYFPAFGRTLKKLNYSFKDYRIADHTPITVELIINK